MRNNRYKGNINNTSVIIFFNRQLTIPGPSSFLMAFSLDRVYILGDLSKLNKTPSDGTCLEEPRRGFCDVACSYCFYLNGGFSFIAFRRHSSFLGFSVTILP